MKRPVDTRDIAATAIPCCSICGQQGLSIYAHLPDRLFGTPGFWSIRCCADERCGLLWLDPVPDEAELARIYQHYYTHDERGPKHDLRHAVYSAVRDAYLARHLGYEQGNTSVWKRWLWHAARFNPAGAIEIELEVMMLPAPVPGMSLLDVGCGSGLFLNQMRSRGWIVYGLDTDPKGVESARARGVPARLGTLQEQYYARGSFDAVTLSHVVEHVHDPAELLAECQRVLRPGGILVLRTPNSESWGRAHYGQDWVGLDVPRHLHLFSSRNLRRLAEGTGFRIIALRSVASSFVRFALSTSDSIRSNRLYGRPVGWDIGPRARLKRIAFQLWERILVKTHPTAGEELLLVAQKALGSSG